MSQDSDTDKYVTQAQCVKQVVAFTRELQTVKNALVGEDLRSGVVKDISEMRISMTEMKGDVNAMRNRKKEREDLSLKWKVSILGVLGTSITAIALVVCKIIEVL